MLSIQEEKDKKKKFKGKKHRINRKILKLDDYKIMKIYEYIYFKTLTKNCYKYTKILK